LRIKVFKARTTKEAMARVKSELGLDAVILHTKRYRKGSFLGYKGKEMVEVTAAVEDMPKRQTKAVPSPKKTVEEQERFVPKNVLNRYKTDASLSDLQQETKKVSAEPNQKKRVIKADDQKMQFADIIQEDPQEKKIEQLQQELSQMKLMLEKVMVENAGSGSNIISLKQALLEQEVNKDIVENIVGGTKDLSILLDKQNPETESYLSEYLEDALCIAQEGIEIPAGQTKIVALIGATGVGKTTTVAKIAAKFVLEKGLSVALITADTYRISAVEQLKTYSDIIGLPLEIVYSPTELKTAVEKHRDKQLILIDTAGRSQHNEFQINELKEFLAVDPLIEKHLVLSATTKYKDAVDIIKKFSPCLPDRVLFTKTDETSSVGLIINLAQQYSIKLSYLTNGQSVPDDIIPAEPKSLAEMLLR
jgi:flagellar biosynthesis protein FlhF